MLAFDIQEHPAYTCNFYALKLGVVATALAAAGTLTYPWPYNLVVTSSVIGLSVYLFVASECILSKIKTLWALDLFALSYCLPICVTQWVALWCFPDIEVSTGVGCMVVLSALLFYSTTWMALYVLGAVGSWFLLKLALGGAISPNVTVQLLIVAPSAALLARITIFKTFDTVYSARLREQETVQELRTTLAKLQDEVLLREVTEVQLQRAQKNEGLGVMAAGVAHDFNNTLAAINAFAEVIGLASSEQLVKSHASEITKAVKQASAICKQMLTYAGKSPSQMAEIDLVGLTHSLHAMMQATCGKRITVRVESEVAAAVVTGNAAQLQQVLLNLVTNSAEAIAGVGTIDVTVRKVGAEHVRASASQYSLIVPDQQGELFTLTVTDSGTGMGADAIRQMFDPYFTTKGVGHGFGLANVLGIVRLHKVSLLVKSEMGRGTSVTLCFSPVTEQAARVDNAGEVAAAASKPRNARILLVDDDELVRDSLAEVLAFQGWEVAKAANGEAALELVRNGQDFAALLIDFSMQDMNGCETLRGIRELGCSSPAILCSGHVSAPMHESGKGEFQAVLQKPFRRVDLEATLQRVMGGITSSEVRR